MPRYRVVRKSFLNLNPANPLAARIYKIGEVVEYDGPAGTNLEPLDAEAIEAKQAHGRPYASQLAPYPRDRGGA
ncbi:MAG: hypothetical protein GEU95_17625 [Rhizobiales bacterium]|nr:hypothetical protein [Hyphomicrobiales bacterium]